eukprot:TRINITY_DN15827_c0_g3_i1.p1 TRINITY_DN15827_c0_g3~~TRINITY_DN15827_c0_g3_i1.p1  ORF type:complete len:1147 (+),score=354.79 TRINITY_DN15827_c0_g3_i1:291-3731(+)
MPSFPKMHSTLSARSVTHSQQSSHPRDEDDDESPDQSLQLPYARYETGASAEPPEQPSPGSLNTASAHSAGRRRGSGWMDSGYTPPAASRDHAVIPLGDTGQAKSTLLLIGAFTPPLAIFVALFTEVGFGASVKKMLRDPPVPASPCFALGLLLFLLAYVCDIFKREPGCVKRVVIGGAAGSMVIGALMMFSSYPYTPLCVFAILLPVYFVAIKLTCFAQVQLIRFVQPMAIACAVVGVLCFLLSVAWAVHNHFLWSQATKCEFAARLRECVNASTVVLGSRAEAMAAVNASSFGETCDLLRPANESDTAGKAGVCWKYGINGEACLVGCEEPPGRPCDPTVDHCLAAFLLWSSAFVLSAAVILFGIVLYFIGRGLRPRMGSDPHSTSVVYIVATLLLGLWIAAQIGGSSMELANVLYALVGIGFGLLVAIITSSFGWEAFHQRIEDIPLMATLMRSGKSDWTRGLALLVGFPVLVLFFILSMLNQASRKCRSVKMDEAEAQCKLTHRGMVWWRKVNNWHKVSVLRKMVIWGFAFFVLQVGAGKVVVLFLSWLNEMLRDLSLAVVSIVIWVIGLVLLLLPMVPGIPVYLTVGVLLGRAGELQFGNFGVGVIFAVGIAMSLKLVAIAAQQKGIGGPLGNRLYVKRTVAINSMTIRAIRHILNQRGLGKDKVAVLLGGPDWPTSVLTGILDLSLSQMLIGSLPFVFPIGLTVAAGALMLKKDAEGIWPSLTTVFQMVAMLTNLVCFLAALSAISRTQDEHFTDIAAPPAGTGPPDDEEVKAADEEGARAAARLRIATEWSAVPGSMRMCILLSAALMWMSFAFFTFKSSQCWEVVEVTTDLNGPPLNGSFLKLVKMPYGWGGLGLHGFSLILYNVFGWWANAQTPTVSEDRVNKYLAATQSEASPPRRRGAQAPKRRFGGAARDGSPSASPPSQCFSPPQPLLQITEFHPPDLEEINSPDSLARAATSCCEDPQDASSTFGGTGRGGRFFSGTAGLVASGDALSRYPSGQLPAPAELHAGRGSRAFDTFALATRRPSARTVAPRPRQESPDQARRRATCRHFAKPPPAMPAGSAGSPVLSPRSAALVEQQQGWDPTRESAAGRGRRRRATPGGGSPVSNQPLTRSYRRRGSDVGHLSEWGSSPQVVGL